MIPAGRPVCLAGLLAACLLAACPKSMSTELIGAPEEPEDSSQQQAQQEGSWSHWWSYDGISGPDYWNINKHWRLCASGRKQSPVNIRTERLIYDHLLGPIRLRWQQERGGVHQEDPSVSTSTNQKTIPVKLINSGRGIEAWLERAGSALIDSPSSSPTSPKIDHGGGEQLILSHGPLSYEYKFFKIELHSAPPSGGRFASGQQQTMLAAADAPNNNQDEEEEQNGEEQATNAAEDNGGGINLSSDWDEAGGASGLTGAATNEILPEALRTPKSSEHLIDGRSFEAELQLHFYNRHLASSAQEALRLANEQPLASLFAVISVLISLRRQQTQDGQSRGRIDNKYDNQLTMTTSMSTASPLDFMLDNLDRLQNQGDSVELKLTRDQLDSLFTDKRQYVTYQGSMNRPPCAEAVDWIILNRPLRLAKSKFVQLFEKTNTNQENIRPIKQLNNRLLRTTINNLIYKRATGSDPSAATGFALEKCHKTNCNLATVNRTGLSQTQTNQLDTMKRTRPNPQHCSMKPNYAYQFSYGHFGPQPAPPTPL